MSGQTVQTQTRLLLQKRQKQTFTKFCETNRNEMSLNMRKPTMCILTRYDTNQAVQPLKMARGLKFRI